MRRSLTRYRSVVATANFHFSRPPRCEIRGEAALSRDGQADVRQLAKVEEARQPRVVQKIKLDVEGFGNEVKIVVDSDWAGCSQTRKSTNGG